MKRKVLFFAVTMATIFAFTTNNAMAQTIDYVDIEKINISNDPVKEGGRFLGEIEGVDSTESGLKAEVNSRGRISPEQLAKTKVENLSNEIQLSDDQTQQLYVIYYEIAKRNLTAMNSKRDNREYQKRLESFQNMVEEESNPEVEE